MPIVPTISRYALALNHYHRNQSLECQDINQIRVEVALNKLAFTLLLDLSSMPAQPTESQLTSGTLGLVKWRNIGQYAGKGKPFSARGGGPLAHLFGQLET